MSGLDDAMHIYMAHLVFEEHRPFCYKDFLHFELDGIEYRMAHGTFRNKVSRLIKKGEVELAYYSGLAFYTLKGIKLGKPMTANHMGVVAYHSDPIVKLLRNLPFEKSALHDIHLRFQVNRSWSLLLANPTCKIHPISKDIYLPVLKVDELRIRTTVHKTDTVSVVVGCSCAPIAVDIPGIIRLSNALTRVEEKLLRLVEDCDHNGIIVGGQEGGYNIKRLPSVVPDHKDWVVTMWHFGADACVEYSGEKFSATWQVGEHELIRIYSKDFHGGVNDKNGSRTKRKTRVRAELQEYPQSTVENAIRNIVQSNNAGF